MDKKEKRFNFRKRLLAIGLIPMFIVVIVLTISTALNMNSLGKKEVEGKLNAFALQTLERYQALNDDAYTYEDGKFKKGDIEISNNYKVIDRLKKKTGIDTTIFYKDTRVSTTLKNEDGSRNIGTKASTQVVKKVLENGKKDVESDLVINGEKYVAVYLPLTQEDSGEVIGMVFAGIEMKEVNKQISNSILYSVIAAIVICIITITLLLIFARTMCGALEHSANEIDKISKGKLDYSENLKYEKRADEIGDVTRAAKNVVYSLKKIVQQIIDTSSELEVFSGRFEQSFANIGENIQNIEQAVDEVAKGAFSQAEETQNASNGVSDIGRAIDDTVEHVESLDVSTEKMRGYNDSVRGTLTLLTDSSEQTRQSVNVVYEQTEATNASANDIRSATDMITEIASQTNLLSLNASIEAARAGEMGKGFAVVADEIRTLSEQSKESAEKIGQIVNVLLENSNSSVSTMNKMKEIIEKQNYAISETKSVFESLDVEIANVAKEVSGIYKETKMLDETKTKVLAIVENLAAIAEENAASTEETSASMTELENIVKECNEVTKKLNEISSGLKEDVSVFEICE